MEKKDLTKEELKEFVGGMYQLQTLTEGDINRDINNTNSRELCSCTYNNVSAITNTNNVSTCKCVCN